MLQFYERGRKSKRGENSVEKFDNEKHLSILERNIILSPLLFLG
jgi:hypothetical protein